MSASRFASSARLSGSKIARSKNEIAEPLQADLGRAVPHAKIFRFTCALDRWLSPRVPPRQEGRIAIVTERGAGRDAMDAAASQDERRFCFRQSSVGRYRAPSNALVKVGPRTAKSWSWRQALYLNLKSQKPHKNQALMTLAWTKKKTRPMWAGR